MKFFLIFIIFFKFCFADIIQDDFPNTTNESFLINIGDDVNGTIESDNDIDYFKFILNKNDGIQIDGLSENCHTSNTGLKLYLKSESLYFSDDLYFDINKSTSILNNLNSGNYYIYINAWASEGDRCKYHFKVSSYQNDSNISLDSFTIKYCQENPTSCGIENTQITKNEIDSLGSGWSLIGTQYKLADFSIFDDVKIVWYYNNGWKAYSKNSNTQNIINNNNINTFNLIDKNKGFWIYK